MLVQLVHTFGNFTKIDFFDFSHSEGVNCGQTWTKNATFGYVMLLKKIEFMKMLLMAVKCVLGLLVVKNLA